MSRILVINPNSTVEVTDYMSAALDPLRMAGGPAIDCTTLADGPPGIETQRDSDGVILPLCRLIEREAAATDAFVIGCFSDPGLHSCREVTERPVFGIGQAGYLTAAALGERFGVLSILDISIPRHLRYIRMLGLTSRLAGDRAIGLGVTELGNETATRRRLSQVATDLIEQDGADCLILGCAGMARYRSDLEQELGRPVIDPTQAAVTMALGAAQLKAAAEPADTVQIVSV
jgi:Asp/Glu/hydantoin racemase